MVKHEPHQLFTLLFFVFHIGLLLTPVFLLAHNIILKERWGFSLPTIPEGLADVLTIAVMVAAVFLILRRIALSEVRILSTAYDYLILAIAVAPFVTGFIAHHAASECTCWLIIHIICGEIMLVAIPFTRLSHMLIAPLTRAYMGSEFGGVRHARDW